MFAYIKGHVVRKNLDRLIVECNNKGYWILASSYTLEKLNVGQEVQIFTKLIVREDDVSLVGFFDENEERAYELLTSVSKVGSKLALSILSTYEPNRIYKFIVENSVTSLSKVPGLGKKMAERIILELKDKVEKIYKPLLEEEIVNVQTNVEVSKEELSEAIEGLMSLGFSFKDADDACNKVAIMFPNADVAEIIRRALALLG